MHIKHLIAGALALVATLVTGAASAKPFSFVALGDTAYNPPGDYPIYEALIAKINASKPAFTIHVGDTWGLMDCREPQQRMILDWFNKYDQPVFYTPGDNEWVDCVDPAIPALYAKHKGDVMKIVAERPDLAAFYSFDAQYSKRFADDSNARLEDIRKVFFAKPESLGRKHLPLTRQSDVSAYTKMVENARWEHEGVMFATVNIAGSANNFTINNDARAQEALARHRADIDWIKATFAEAKAKNAAAVVISMHAALFVDGPGYENFTGTAVRGGPDGPYYWTVWAIRDQAAQFGKPVLLINGDFHDFIVDLPFRVGQGEGKPPLYGNITRLQVWGAPDIRAVKVSVDTAKPWVFGFEPLY